MAIGDRGRLVEAPQIEQVVRSLTVLDLDVDHLEARLPHGRAIDPGSAALCIIDIDCCIIDCSSCTPDDVSIYEDPQNRLRGFVFRIPEQAGDPHAPVYYLTDTDLPSAFRAGHRALRVPGETIKASVLGLAGEILHGEALTTQNIAPTAPVIQLIPVHRRTPR